MSVTTFPSQKIRTSARSEKFYKDCVEAALEMLRFEDASGVRMSLKEKQINYDLANNILDPSDMESILNPWNIEGYDFPSEVRNYALIRPKVDLMVGEAIRRRFDWRLVLRNPDAVSEKEDMLKEAYFRLIQEAIQAKSFDEKEFQKKMEKLNAMSRFEMQDIREKMGTELLCALYEEQQLAMKFARGFEDMLTASEQIYSLNLLAGEPVVFKEDPKYATALRSGDSPYIEDSDILIFSGYWPVGKVIDYYHDQLKPEQLTKLMEQSRNASNPEEALNNMIIPDNYMQEAFGTNSVVVANMDEINTFTGSYDQAGNVLVHRVLWKSLRMIYEKTHFDEDGYPVKTYEDENYKEDPDSGETLKKLWITEWLTAAKVGEFHLKGKPFPRIGVSMTNPSRCQAPVVGSAYNIGSNKAVSFYSMTKPYQYLYNLVMHNTEQAVIKSRGSIPVLPLHMIPDGWTVDDWLYHVVGPGVAVEDAFKESNKGLIGGNLTRGDRKIDLSNTGYIQQNAAVLAMIKSTIDEISGISPQRQGQIEQRELVGNTERAITNSSNITEKWFMLHDNTKLRVMTGLLELARYAYRTRKFKRQFVLSDMSIRMLDFDGPLFASAEYGLFLSNSMADTEVYNKLMMLSERALQAQQIRMSDIIGIMTDRSMSSAIRKLEDSEARSMEMAQQNQQAAQQAQMAQVEQRKAEATEKNALTERIALMEDGTRRYIAELEARTRESQSAGSETPEMPEETPVDESSDIKREEIAMKDRHHKDKMALERKKLEEKTSIDLKKLNKPSPARSN